MAPLQAAVNAVVTPVVSFSDGLSNLAGLREENQRLRDRIESLEREAALVGHLEAQVSELETLLALRLGEDLYPALGLGRGHRPRGDPRPDPDHRPWYR